MRWLNVWLGLIILFRCGTSISAFDRHKDAWSLQYDLPKLTEYLQLEEPKDAIEQVSAREKENADHLKAWVYAVGIDVDIRPRASGQWDTVPGKGYVWRMGIRAENALSLNLLIENFRLQSGASLYVYDEAVTVSAGPFDIRNNKNGGILPVPSISGNTLIIEWNIPLNSNDCEGFVIANVGYGFRDMSGGNRIVSKDVSAPCHVDINCKDGNHWQREKRSVVRLETITRSPGVTTTQYCSGVLVNRVSDTKKPYVLTANHCIASEEAARSTSFVFGYEKAVCGGALPSIPSGIAGADLIAAKKELDFSLLELSEEIPINYRPYYAGWSASSNVPVGGTGIHHPQGDVKKIAVCNNPLTTGTYKDEKQACDAGAHWVVGRWSKGTTEQGSSGSPLFDQSHLLAGILTGGEATCSRPVNDYYAKFGEQWDKYPTPEESLKTWLDPDNKGINRLNGYDPVAPFEGRCDTISHIGNNEAKVLIPSDRWGYLTGHNDKRWTSFAEKMNNDTVVKIIGMEAYIGKVHSSGSVVTFSVWTGDEFPVGGPMYAKKVIVSPDYRQYPMHVYFEKTLEITGDYFIGYSIDYSPVDTFAVCQSVKRPYEGLSAMYVEDGGVWKALDKEMPPIYSSLAVQAMGQFGKGQIPSYRIPYKDLRIVFQPGNNTVFVYFDNPGGGAVVECFDTSGKQMPVDEVSRHIVLYDETVFLQVELNAGNLPSGMYIIRMRDSKKSESGKFVKL